jgi:hypothetical protein
MADNPQKPIRSRVRDARVALRRALDGDDQGPTPHEASTQAEAVFRALLDLPTSDVVARRQFVAAAFNAGAGILNGAMTAVAGAVVSVCIAAMLAFMGSIFGAIAALLVAPAAFLLWLVGAFG